MAAMRIPKQLYQQIIDHCKKEYPREACGLVAGVKGLVTAVFSVPNVASDPYSNYLVDSTVQAELFRLMAAKNWELTAIYHSHPSGAACPSESDIRQAYYEDAFMLIVGLHRTKPDVRLYRVQRRRGTYAQARLLVLGDRKNGGGTLRPRGDDGFCRSWSGGKEFQCPTGRLTTMQSVLFPR
ncbi:MAG TPA: M67 family metallopeptidase [Firmicutes bacterium]|nr:M67 family metallopeptidase [Bacillota bacterium]